MSIILYNMFPSYFIVFLLGSNEIVHIRDLLTACKYYILMKFSYYDGKMTVKAEATVNEKCGLPY